jgi:hypothetical protein
MHGHPVPRRPTTHAQRLGRAAQDAWVACDPPFAFGRLIGTMGTISTHLSVGDAGRGVRPSV